MFYFSKRGIYLLRNTLELHPCFWLVCADNPIHFSKPLQNIAQRILKVWDKRLLLRMQNSIKIEDYAKNFYEAHYWENGVFRAPRKCATFKGSLFFGEWDKLFWQNRLGPSIIVVWPRELVRLIGNCLQNIFIIYHVVIRRIGKFLRVCEIQIQIFWHLKKHENHHDLSIFFIVW